MLEGMMRAGRGPAFGAVMVLSLASGLRNANAVPFTQAVFHAVVGEHARVAHQRKSDGSTRAANLSRRRGVVRLEGKAAADDDGPFLGLGASLFWSTWGSLHDRARWERNLALLRNKVDYIRVLGIVGWPNRTTTLDDFTAAVVGDVTDTVYDRYGFRVKWVIFGGVAGDAAARSAAVDRFIAAARPRQEKIYMVEVANEAFSTGFDDKKAEIKAYATRLRAQLMIPVATSSINGPSQTLADWYDGSSANVVTVHVDRNISADGGLWRPVHQTREGRILGRPWSSDEPIGIDSSVARDGDPLRLAMAAAVAWQCQAFDYTLHSGAGIRGGEDPPAASHPFARKANLWDQPEFGPALDAIRTVRALLPADLPNWAWSDGSGHLRSDYPFNEDAVAAQSGDGPTDRVLGMFASVAPDRRRVIAMPIKVRPGFHVEPKWTMRLTAYDPLTGQVLDSRDVSAGQRYDVPAGRGAVILVGTLR
jgi:hypothetical protein